MSNEHLLSEHRLRRKLDLLLKTGLTLLESAADTNRIDRNMHRVAAFLGLKEENLHINVSYTMLMVNYSDETHSFTKFQRCDRHVINMHTLSAVSKLSWKAIKEDYSMTRFEEELEAIRRRERHYRPLWVALGAALACGGFCIQFGGDWVAFLYASLAAWAGFSVRLFLHHTNLNMYMNTAAAAFMATLVAWLTTFLPAEWTATPYHPLLACALFIVPGVPIINFVDDMLDNYIQVGLTRFMNTLLIVASMTFGLVLAVKVCGVDNFVTTLSLRPEHAYWEYALAAAISAIGFSMIFNVPPRLLPVVALGGIVAVCTRNFVNLEWGLGLTLGSLAGSTLISVLAVKVVHWVHTPHHVISIPSVIPMIPGVLMYRGVFSLIALEGHVGELTFSAKYLVAASLAVLAISLGVAIPNIFARRWIAPGRRRLLAQLIDERRQRGKFVDLKDFD